MREIRFRAWHTEPGSDAHMDYEIYDVEPTTDQVFMQFTGLKDKNGKEIYEGDCFGGIWGGYVDWCEKCKSDQLIGFGDDIGCMACIGDVHWAEIVEDEGLEVIGNVHENPELLVRRLEV